MKPSEKSVPAGRRAHPRQRGAALLIFMVLVVVAALAYLVNNIGAERTEARRERQTQEALATAREALIGYALKYREEQLAQGQPDKVYGYLPLPDLGSSRNNNAGCTQEGCDAANFSGNALNTTVIGRLPWRKLGIEPLRDGHGECLWYAVSGSHQRIQQNVPLNWDTLGHLDIVVADGTATLKSALASAHDRPVAVIFSPGPPLPGQNREKSATDDVTQCGGNYDAANYLDPATAGALGGPTNYLANANHAFGVTDPAAPKALSLQGKVFASAGKFLPGACAGGDCTLAANDVGLPLTGDTLFAAIRKHAYFRTDINSLLDRMVFCLRDQIVAGGFTPAAIAGFTPPADKSAGRIPDHACYDSSQNPRGYYDHYKELIFVAKPNTGNFTVNGDPNCSGVLLFAGQRGGAQQRATAAQKNAPANYLEGGNLASFTAAGTTFGSVGSPILLDRSPPQAPEQDIARCIPVGASFTLVTSPTLSAQGFDQLVAYDATTRTLTLGKQDVTTGFGAGAGALFGCAWLADVRTLGSGLHTYFRFQFKKLGTSVGSNGFVFALADATRNSFLSCGAAGSHLGYSGNNGTTPIVNFPKIGIEFDQGRNTGSIENADPTLSGRNDPCGTSGCGGTVGYNSHAAIVYWGHETGGADGVSIGMEDYDDNVHGIPSAQIGSRPPPPNPATAPGIQFINMRGYPNNSFDSRIFHVRVELNRVPFRQLSAVRVASGTNLNLSSPGAIIDSVALSPGDRVLVNAQTSSADNGIYVWNGASTPMTRTSDADSAAEISGATVQVLEGTYAGPAWVQSLTVTTLGTDPQNWQPHIRKFRTEVWIEPQPDPLPDPLPDTIIALKNITRPMSLLYPTYAPTLSDTATMYPIAGGNCPCSSGQTCGTDGLCYRPAMQSVQLGFTGSQRTQDQEVTINDFFTTWLP
jgi:type II secretory pathway pseudopilin PulG